MAMATLMKSSDFEEGMQGRERALWYCHAAKTALEQDYASGQRTTGMAQAALVFIRLVTSLLSYQHPIRF
jgi:hypothetical protein